MTMSDNELAFEQADLDWWYEYEQYVEARAAHMTYACKFAPPFVSGWRVGMAKGTAGDDFLMVTHEMSKVYAEGLVKGYFEALDYPDEKGKT